MDSATDIHELWTLQKLCDTYGHRKCVNLNNSKLPIIFNSFKNVFPSRLLFVSPYYHYFWWLGLRG